MVWGAVREFESMVDSQSAARKLKRFARFAAAAAVLLAISPAAKAQGLFSLFGGGPSPYEIERRLEAGGYALTGPLVRRGDIYLADVVVGRGDFERLLIDAETGRVLQQFRARPARWRDAAARDWDRNEPDRWGSAPRPPAAVDLPPPSRETLGLPPARPEPQASTREQLARGDDAAKPNVILGPGAARATSSDANKKPKPSDAKRKIVAPAQAAKSANPPAPGGTADSAAAPSTTTIAVTPPAANAAPVASRPAQAASTAANGDAPSSLVATKSPPPAETPQAHEPSKTKPVNDLPVTPLD
jgi:hypothetical protein